jgi:hypothetical protein
LHFGIKFSSVGSKIRISGCKSDHALVVQRTSFALREMQNVPDLWYVGTQYGPTSRPRSRILGPCRLRTIASSTTPTSPRFLHASGSCRPGV